MRRFSTSIDIAAPPERVYDVIVDVERWHEWTPSITRASLRSGPPLTIGSLAIVRQPKLPPAMWSVTDVQPGRGFTWQSRAPGLRVVGIHSVEPAPGGSRATLAIEIRGLFGPLWARLSKAITERYIGFEAVGLKARSEDAGYVHAGARR